MLIGILIYIFIINQLGVSNINKVKATQLSAVDHDLCWKISPSNSIIL
jgi:hypothetical protein